MFTELLLTALATVSLISAGAPGVSNNAERQTYELVFSSYDATIRPKTYPTDTVEVTIYLALKQVIGFNEVDQILETQGLISSTWTDDFLQWDDTHYGGAGQPVPYLVVPATEVWRPDFGLQNSAHDFYKENYWRDYRVLVQADGTIIWNYGGIFSTTCSLDITNYPFDTQTCNVTLSSWSYYIDDVTLKCGQAEVLLDDYQEDGQWSLVNTTCIHDPQVLSDTITISRLTFSLKYARKTWWYTLNIFIPTLLMILLVMVMFWLPPESGEKIGMGVTILLAFSVFQLLIASDIPRTSSTTPMLSAVMIFVMSMTTISIVNTIIVLRLHHHSSSRRAPGPVRYMLFNVLARPMCLGYLIPGDENGGGSGDQVKPFHVDQDGKDFTPHYNINSNGVSNNSGHPPKPAEPAATSPGVMGDILQNVQGIKQGLVDQRYSNTMTDEWKALAAVWERFMFWIVFLIVLIVVPYFFISGKLGTYHA